MPIRSLWLTPECKQNLQLIDPHGDTVSTITTGTQPTLTAFTAFDEYGNQLNKQNPTNPATASSYGWVGKAEKPTTVSGLILMGARLYNSVTGRFTSRDPVPGGNENAYNYPNDPINGNDWTGCMSTIQSLALTALCFSEPDVCLGLVIAMAVIEIISLRNSVYSHKGWTGKKKDEVFENKAIEIVVELADQFLLSKIFGCNLESLVEEATGSAVAKGGAGQRSLDLIADKISGNMVSSIKKSSKFAKTYVPSGKTYVPSFANLVR
jgi:RHS repeat-associated protein